MPDLFTEVTKSSYGQRLSKSFGGIIIGFLLFIGSFVVLYNNEGSIDYSEIAKTATEVSSTKGVEDSTLKEKLLVTSGELVTEDQLSTKYIKPDTFLALSSKVEMYAWDEDSKSSSESEIGGSEKTTTTYTYKKVWTEKPSDSSRFRIPEGHGNPELPYESETVQAESAKLGVFDVDVRGLSLPEMKPLSLSSNNTVLADGARLSSNKTAINSAPVASTQAATQATQAAVQTTQATTETFQTSNYIFVSQNAGSSIDAPQVGDIRISYEYLPNKSKVTLFGKLTENTFGPYVDNNKTRFYQAFLGTKEDAITSLHQSYVASKWIMRLVGFIMMWAGLSMILGPISALLNVLPFFASLSGALINVVTFVVALVLSIVTILISMLFHNILALILAVVIVGGVTFTVLNNKKAAAKSVSSTPASPPTPPTTPPNN